MARKRQGQYALMLCSALALAACSEGKNFDLFKKKPTSGSEVSSGNENPGSTKLVERDVEAPDVFQVATSGLWDGRPSLGGVWVAHPDVTAPERVIIRNDSNGKFVIGALFKRERTNPGPALQVSSDAAAALGMLAGAPAELNVTALRREEVPTTAPGPMADATGTLPEAAGAVALTSPEAIESATLDDPAALASAALDAAGAAAPAANARPAAPPAAGPAMSLDRPFIQIGFFNVEENAERSGEKLREAGIFPAIVQEDSNGKPYWRVLAGPAPTQGERAALLEKLRDLGYSDAYFVAN